MFGCSYNSSVIYAVAAPTLTPKLLQVNLHLHLYGSPAHTALAVGSSAQGSDCTPLVQMQIAEVLTQVQVLILK